MRAGLIAATPDAPVNAVSRVCSQLCGSEMSAETLTHMNNPSQAMHMLMPSVGLLHRQRQVCCTSYANWRALLLVIPCEFVTSVAEARAPLRGPIQKGPPIKTPNRPPPTAFAPQQIPLVARWMEQPAEGTSAKLRPSAWQQQHSLRVARSLATGGTWRRIFLICWSLQSASPIWWMPSGTRQVSAGKTV